MNTLNWKEFQIVNLSRKDNDWISISGNLTDEGIACVYCENNQEYMMEAPLNTMREMKEILISYFKGDGQFKKIYKFVKEKSLHHEAFIDQNEYQKWKDNFLLKRKKEKIADIKKTLLSILIIGLLSLLMYTWYTGELQFIGQNTEYTPATIINTQMVPIGKGYYKQLVTYEFKFEGTIYQGTFKAGKTLGRQEVGHIVKIKFSTINPNRSLMVGFY